MISIIDYSMGNVMSVKNAFELLGKSCQITSNIEEIQTSDAIVLPGVGAFKDGMKNLKNLNLIDTLHEEVLVNKKPYLGICLGLEFLAKRSFEGGEHPGLNWINATVKKIESDDEMIRVPHMGWNDTNVTRSSQLFREIEKPIFYYLHSYHFNVDESESNIITSTCDYGGIKITSSIQKENIFAVQFHPEKSQSTGLKLIQNFLKYVDDIC